jgi:hypothetical protein
VQVSWEPWKAECTDCPLLCHWNPRKKTSKSHKFIPWVFLGCIHNMEVTTYKRHSTSHWCLVLNNSQEAPVVRNDFFWGDTVRVSQELISELTEQRMQCKLRYPQGESIYYLLLSLNPEISSSHWFNSYHCTLKMFLGPCLLKLTFEIMKHSS